MKFDAKNYVASVRQFEEDGDTLYFAWFPQLGEGIHAIAEKSAIALQHAYETLADIAQSATDAGSPLPEPVVDEEPEYSGRFSVRVSKTLHSELAACAEREKLSMNAYVHEALSRHASWSQLTGLTCSDLDTTVRTTAYSDHSPMEPYVNLSVKKDLAEKSA